eukprot:168287_1
MAEEQKQQKQYMLFIGASLTSGYGTSSSFPSQISSILKDNASKLTVLNAGVAGASTNDGINQIKPYIKYNITHLFIFLGLADCIYQHSMQAIQENIANIVQFSRDKFGKNVKLYIHDAKVFQHHYLGTKLTKKYENEFNAIWKTMCKEFDLILIPFILENVTKIKHLNQTDMIHPNENGTKIMTQNLWRFLKQTLN